MRDYAKVHKSGASVTMTAQRAGMYEVVLRSAGGAVLDKMRCDHYRMALDYRRAFNAIAKGLK